MSWPVFKIKAPHAYDTKDVQTFNPRLIGVYSLKLSEDKLKCYLDDRCLREIRNDLYPFEEYDLTHIIDGVNEKDHDHSRMRFEGFLEWILDKKQSAGPESSSHKLPDFVCQRGALAMIMCSPFEPEKYWRNWEGWTIIATKFQGTIYFKSHRVKKVKEQESEGENLSSLGFKFEYFMTKGSNPEEACDENNAYSCVVQSELRSKLASHTLLYPAEMDAVDYNYNLPADADGTGSSRSDNNPPSGVDGAGSSRFDNNPPADVDGAGSGRSDNNPPADVDGVRFKHHKPHGLAHCVELKLSKQYYSKPLPPYKRRSWWSQSFLAGVPRIVCGFRDDEAVVQSLVTYPVEEWSSLPDSNRMTIFLNEFLVYLKETIVEDDPTVVYELHREIGRVLCKRIINGDLLPKKYVDGMKRFTPQSTPAQ